MLISWEVQQETLSSMKLWIMLTEENVELTGGTISSPPPCYQGEGCAIKTHVARCINSSIKARPPPSSLPIGRAQRGAIWLVESRPRSAIDRRWIKTTILDKLRSSCVEIEFLTIFYSHFKMTLSIYSTGCFHTSAILSPKALHWEIAVWLILKGRKLQIHDKSTRARSLCFR